MNSRKFNFQFSSSDEFFTVSQNERTEITYWKPNHRLALGWNISKHKCTSSSYIYAIKATVFLFHYDALWWFLCIKLKSMVPRSGIFSIWELEKEWADEIRYIKFRVLQTWWCTLQHFLLKRRGKYTHSATRLLWYRQTAG